jgi:hypothetical protein
MTASGSVPPSMKSKIARRASACVRKRCRSSGSHSRVAKKLSHFAWPYASPTEPMDGRTPASRHRWPKATEVYCAALIRVMNDVRRPPLRDGHIQRGQDELGPEMSVHRPADHASTPGIEHDGETEEAGPGRHVGDVRDPQLIRDRSGELAVDEIRRRPGRLVTYRREERLPPAHAL